MTGELHPDGVAWLEAHTQAVTRLQAARVDMMTKARVARMHGTYDLAAQSDMATAHQGEIDFYKTMMLSNSLLLVASSDPVLRWIGVNLLPRHSEDVALILERWPVSDRDLVDLADREGWCDDFSSLRARAIRDGVLVQTEGGES